MAGIARAREASSISSPASGFVRLWAATGVTNIGDGIALTAAPLLAASLTRDPALIAGMAVALKLPWLLFTMPSGVLVDRINRRTAMVIAHGSRSVILGVLAAFTLGDWISIALLYLLLFGIGAIETVADTTALAMLPAIVPRDHLDRANGRLFATMSVTNEFAGPPLGGLLFGIRTGFPFATAALSFGLAAWLIGSIPGRFQPHRVSSEPSDASFWLALRTGFGWFWHNLAIRAAGIMVAISNFWGTAVMATFVLVAQDRLELGDAGYGVILAAGAIGGVAGGLLADRLTRLVGPGTALFIDNMVYGLAFFGIAISREPVVVGLMFAMMSFSSMIGNVTLIFPRQRLIPDDLLGRVTSAYRMFAIGAVPAGAAAGGLLAREFTLTTPAWVAGFAMLVTAVVMLRVLNNRTIQRALESGPRR